MAKITIKNITHEEKVSQRTGKKFNSCRITVVGRDGKDVNLSGFGSPVTKTWNVGDVVDIDLVQTEQGYWNFSENKESKPSPDKKLELLISLNAKIDKLIELLSNDKKQPEVTVEECEKIFGKDPELNGSDMPDFLKP